MSPESHTQVLIVGAGPTGLTLAAELARHGIACQIIDRASQPTTTSRALGIHARTLEIFDSMGIVERFIEAGVQIDTLNVYADGHQVLNVALGELDSHFPFTLALPQSKTERLLTENLQSHGVDVHRGAELKDLSQDKDGVSARVSFANGPAQEIRASWLVGCDGAHSTVRHALKLSFAGSQYQESFLLADVKVDGSLDHNSMQMFTTKEGLLGFIPLDRDRFRLIADRPQIARSKKYEADLQPSLPDPTLEDMQEIVEARGPGGLSISDPIWLAAFNIHMRLVPTYRQGRIFLAGDAAHIHSPAGGQGMNTGIQDAVNLSWKLSLVLKGAGNPLLLDSYDYERRRVAESVLKMTDFITRVNTLRHPIAREIRNRLAPIIAGQEVIQRRLIASVSELAINYRHSPIVAEHKVGLVQAATTVQSTTEHPEFGEWFQFERGPASGDRAPDAHLTDDVSGITMRLFELMRGTEHHLLLFAGARSSLSGLRDLIEIADFAIDNYAQCIRVHLIAERKELWQDLPWSGSRISDPNLAAHHKYGAGSECLYLIRPDGYIAFRSLPADQLSLADYLERIFVA